MKFDDLYPQHKKTPTLMGPNNDVWVTDSLAQTWRRYSCFICKEMATYVLLLDNSPSHICSEECMARAIEQNDENRAEFIKDAPDIVEALDKWLTL